MKALVFLLLFTIGLTADAQVTNRFAFPALAGTKFTLLNVVNGTNDSGNSPSFGVPANFYHMDWAWGTNGPTATNWTQWIKPQIDAAKLAGANAIRLMWSADAFIGDATHHGLATWEGSNNLVQLQNEIGQFCSYCASNGLYAYPAATESRVIDIGNLNTNLLCQYLSNFVACASSYDNVVGIDAVQEADGATGGSNNAVAQNVGMWIAAAKSGRTRLIPVTCSLNGAAYSTDLNPTNRWFFAKLAAAGADYFDPHWYYRASIYDFWPVITNQWNLPVIFGECGINFNGNWTTGNAQETTHPYSSEKRDDFFFTLFAVAQLPYFQLRGNWGIAPNWLTNEEDWGMYDGSQSATYALTNSRRQIRITQAMAQQVQPRNPTWNIWPTNLPTTAANYLSYSMWGVQSDMEQAAPVWQWNGGFLQSLGNISALTYSDDGNLLFQTALPNTLGQSVQFDIPPQTPGLYVSRFATWSCFVRDQPNGDNYLIELVADTSHVYDNKIDIFKFVSGTLSTLAETYYTNQSFLDLTKQWRVTVNVSTNSNPTTISVTYSNVTSGILMTNPCAAIDSSATLQLPGGAGLCGYQGNVFYTNVSFQQVYDFAPTIATIPAATPTGTSVALSWPLADGGSGAISYTPQYVVADTLGFPAVMTWTNGQTVSGLNETLTSLPANTNLIFRVMTEDATGATNYSPWQAVATSGGGATTTPVYLPFHY
jgi:hypothetical protein